MVYYGRYYANSHEIKVFRINHSFETSRVLIKMSKEKPAIRGIMFTEFHPDVGPRIVFQVPEEVVTRDVFDMLHIYIIPKKQLQKRIITLNFSGHKIVGCPVCIEGSQYKRNALIFNCCFVLNASTNAAIYENAVRKLSAYLTSLEQETKEGFISNKKNKEKLPVIMKVLLDELQTFGRSHLSISGSTTLHLQVEGIADGKDEVKDHDVPVFVTRVSSLDDALPHIDLATRQLLPLIDGERHVARIADDSDFDLHLVQDSIKMLISHGAVKLIPVFQYTNVYTTTAAIDNLIESSALQEECLEKVAIPGKNPSMCDIFQMYCSLVPGTTVRDLCQRFQPRSRGIDERKLVQFGLIQGFIRRLHKYPMRLMPSESSLVVNGYGKLMNDSHFTGQFSFDEICTKTGVSYEVVDEKVESDSSIIVCWK